MNEKKRVVVAMSGGVDSSVAAALLVQQGYQVIGMMLSLWSEPGTEKDNKCCTPEAMALARRVCAILEIPFYAIDAREPFRSTVVQSLLDGYAKGITPNPCISCNKYIRWGLLFNEAANLGADFMATGHYVRLHTDSGGTIQLLKGVDEKKDQSYVLHMLDQNHLAHALFPLGGYLKPQVRELARQFRLPVAERPESQDLCFLAGNDYRSFLQRYAPEVINPGPIVDTLQHPIGQHHGLAFYTIGQRKGLGIYASQPLYVIDKDIPTNTLIVGPQAALGKNELHAEDVNWISGSPPDTTFQAMVKIRYKAKEAGASISVSDAARVHVRFTEPLRDITPGQSMVMYSGDSCLGGGTISL